MLESDLFENVPVTGDGPGRSQQRLDLGLMDRLARGPIASDNDLTTAIVLARFVNTEYELFGTSGGNCLSNDEARVALRTLRLVLERWHLDLRPPWRDFDSFRTHWLDQGCSGSWQARRELLARHFTPVLDALDRAEEEEFRATLAEAVSPRHATGWLGVDREVDALRQRFRTAVTEQDYRDVGNRSVAVMEALSATVYDPAVHCPAGQEVPPVDKTDIRIGAYIDQRMTGGANKKLRGLVKAASAFAHSVKHSSTPDRTSAGISADGVLMLANILRRLAE